MDSREEDAEPKLGEDDSEGEELNGVTSLEDEGLVCQMNDGNESISSTHEESHGKNTVKTLISSDGKSEYFHNPLLEIIEGP